MIKFPEDITKLDPRHEEYHRRVIEPRIQPVKQHSVSFSTADADVRVRHGMGRAPGGWRVIEQSAAASVYTGSAATRWFLYLRADTVPLTITIEVF